MKIKSFYTTSPIFEGGRFDDDKSVCVFGAPAVFLHMMRCLLDGESDDTPIDESKERTFVSRVNFEFDGEDIELCGVLCDDQSFFVAVKDGEHFSAERTQKVIAKLRSMKRDERNSYNFLNKYVANENNLSECDYNIANFNRFIEIVKEEIQKGNKATCLMALEFAIKGKIQKFATDVYGKFIESTTGRQVTYAD
jgi:hypothetical protein